jgi:hypothetical protein
MPRICTTGMGMNPSTEWQRLKLLTIDEINYRRKLWSSLDSHQFMVCLIAFPFGIPLIGYMYPFGLK